MEHTRPDPGLPIDARPAKDEPPDGWTADDFDHFTDLGLLRRDLLPAEIK